MWCYRIKWYDADNTTMWSEGIVHAESPEEVMKHLKEYYGDFDTVKISYIEESEYDCHILPFDGINCNWDTFIKEENF